MNVLNKSFDLEMLFLSHRSICFTYSSSAITKTIFLSKRQAFTFSLHFEMRLDEEFILLLFSLLQDGLRKCHVISHHIKLQQNDKLQKGTCPFPVFSPIQCSVIVYDTLQYISPQKYVHRDNWMCIFYGVTSNFLYPSCCIVPLTLYHIIEQSVLYIGLTLEQFPFFKSIHIYICTPIKPLFSSTF